MSWQLLANTDERGILTRDALDFVAELHREFDDRRLEQLALRNERQAKLDAGDMPDFPRLTSGDWQVGSPPADLADRRTEITGPVDAKMMISALNSGARVFMADFEDATTPTWANLIDGQANLVEAHRKTLVFESGEKSYRLNEEMATLVVRPRGWHLAEKHLLIDGRTASGSLFDFGLAIFHAGRAALEAGSGPYFYLPKLENHLEARLWNDVFNFAQDRLRISRGTIRATVLIETILAAFEMDEILHELAPHSAGLNAGRWDYIFSVIKKFHTRPDFVLPDRAQVTMTVPFMRAYTELLVATCHRRGAHAMGGMAAFIPNRRQPEVTEVALVKVSDDKRREAGDGFDGTWVAHPDLVPVAMAEFDKVLGTAPHQIARQRPDVSTEPADLLDVQVPGGTVSEAGLRTNIDVGIRYLISWLGGTGAAAIHNLMEDVATAEICRSQLWQWLHHGVALENGRPVTRSLLEDITEELTAEMEPTPVRDQALRLFNELVYPSDFAEFLTLSAYQEID